MAQMIFTIMGCGSSGGVPRIGGVWGDCDPDNPRNARRRCSLLVQRVTEGGTTNALIDTTPDFRSQMIDADLGVLDGVLFTHEHADHTHGLDDLRMIVINKRERLDVWMNDRTAASVVDRFHYAFETPEGSPYPPILNRHLLDGPVTINGAGGPITFEPFDVEHGTIDSLGFKIGDLVYLPDVSAIPETAWPLINGVDYWIIDALRRTPHPSHSHLSNTLEWINRAHPKHAILTNMHLDMDYQTICDETPDNVTAAYDGMQIRQEV